MVLRNSGRVGSRRFLIELIDFRGYALPTIPSGNDLKSYMGTSFRIGQGMVVGC